MDGNYFQDPNDVAAANNWRVRRPEPDQLFIDLDSEEKLVLFRAHFKILHEYEPAPIVMVTPSFTPGHYHVTVTLTRKLKPYERAAYEMALGSDPKRGLLGLQSIKNGHAEDASVFFEPKRDLVSK